MTAVLTRGDTWIRPWEVKDGAGAVINLTGASARLQVRDARLVKIFEASTTTGELVITGSAGKIALRVNAVITKTWAAGKYKFDLEVTDSNGIVRTYESDILEVIADITHD